MKVVRLDSSLGAAILASLLGAAAADQDQTCECPKCVNARALQEKEANPTPAPHGTVSGDILKAGFGDALQALRAGYGVRRSGWNGKGLTVRMQVPDANSKMTLPYLYIEYPADAANTPGARCPWLASQTDILAMDWENA